MTHRDLLIISAAIEDNPGNEYRGYRDCLQAAVKCSGAQVISICANKIGVGESFIDIRMFKRKMDYLRKVYQPSTQTHDSMRSFNLNVLLHWYCVSGLVKAMAIRSPIIVLDWDVMIFQNMVEAIKPFKDMEVGVSTCCGSQQAPTLFNRPSLTRTFHDWVVKLYETNDERTQLQYSHTMYYWSEFLRETNSKVGNINGIVNGAAFDHNVHTEKDTYEMDGETKKIVWDNDRPHFVSKATGELVKANTIHCWGSYKQRTHELLCKARLNES